MTKKTSSEQSSDKILHTVRGEFYDSIADVLRTARSSAYRAVNFVMVEAYWNIGRMIIEEEQQGKERAEYGGYLLRHLSARLTREFGKGLNYTNLKYIRQFYLSYPIGHALRDQSSQTPNCASGKAETNLRALRAELTWTHYRLLIRVERDGEEPLQRFSERLRPRGRGGMTLKKLWRFQPVRVQNSSILRF